MWPVLCCGQVKIFPTQKKDVQATLMILKKQEKLKTRFIDLTMFNNIIKKTLTINKVDKKNWQ